MSLDDRQYDALVSQAWQRLVSAMDRLDPDLVDVTETTDMLSLDFAHGRKCVINTQRAVHQIWVATRTQGVHFSWSEERQEWYDDKRCGYELFAFVASVVTAEIGGQAKV